MLQIRGPILPERLIPQKDMEKVLRQAVEEESDLAGIHFEGGHSSGGSAPDYFPEGMPIYQLPLWKM